MKNRLLAAALLVACVLTLLSSCGLIFGDVEDSGAVTVVIENADGSYDTYIADLDSVRNKSEGAKGIIEYLDATEDSFYLEMVDSTYGAYVSAIGSIKENGSDGMYVMVYTSVSADSYEGAPNAYYEGITLYQAGLGLSGMSVEEGTVILFRLEKSPY